MLQVCAARCTDRGRPLLGTKWNECCERGASCIHLHLIAGLSNAAADELLDLETRDLAEMNTVNGITVVFDPGKIRMVYMLPGPWDRHLAAAAQ